MEYFYSAGERRFYPVPLHDDYLAAGDFPPDTTLVDESLFLRFSAEAPAGKVLGSNKNGLPFWQVAPALDADQMMAEAEGERLSLLMRAEKHIGIWQTELMLGIIKDTDQNSLVAWLAYIRQLKALDTSVGDFVWPEVPDVA